MRIYRDLTPCGCPTAVALGYFDGLHLGHQAVIGKAVDCRSEGLSPTVFTFEKTPKHGTEHAQLLTFDEKVGRLEAMGVEILYVIDFYRIKNLIPEEFVGDVLKKVFGAKKVFCGYNYHFGKHGAGTSADLTEICGTFGIKAAVTPPVSVDGELVSSTKIRDCLRAGEIERANKMLGGKFGYVNRSVEGNHIGTAMGTPTINLPLGEDLLLPRFGVYISEVAVDGQVYSGVTNIGVRPTVSDNGVPNCETWLPRYSGGELYGKRVEVRLVKFLRPERKFASLAELEAAVKADGQFIIDNG